MKQPVQITNVSPPPVKIKMFVGFFRPKGFGSEWSTTKPHSQLEEVTKYMRVFEDDDFMERFIGEVELPA